MVLPKQTTREALLLRRFRRCLQIPCRRRTSAKPSLSADLGVEQPTEAQAEDNVEPRSNNPPLPAVPTPVLAPAPIPPPGPPPAHVREQLRLARRVPLFASRP